MKILLLICTGLAFLPLSGFARTAFYIPPKPAKFRGVDDHTTGFVEVELLANNTGIIKYCNFGWGDNSASVYRFEWTARRGEPLEFHKLRQVSRHGEKIKLTVEWHTDLLVLRMTGKDWNRKITAYDVAMWEKAVSICSGAEKRRN